MLGGVREPSPAPVKRGDHQISDRWLGVKPHAVELFHRTMLDASFDRALVAECIQPKERFRMVHRTTKGPQIFTA